MIKFEKMTEETNPTVWKLELGNIDIIVHRYITDKDTWFLSSKYLDVDTFNLNRSGVDAAKARALAIVKDLIKDQINELMRQR